MPMMVLLGLAAHFHWKASAFDVEAAFLTGLGMKRELLFRPPAGGLPGVPAGALIRAKKGLFGVPEAPRLWYLRIKALIQQAGWHEIAAFPCIFAARGPGGVLEGLLCIHVDDGLLAGHGAAYEKARSKLLETLSIKHVRTDDFVYLRRRIARQADGGFHIYMDVGECTPIKLTSARKAQQDEPVTESERSALRTLVGEISWPAREAFPESAYDASDLQQRVSEATVGTLLRANAVLKRLQARSKAAPALVLPAGDRSGRLKVHMMTDANWARQPKSGSQQGHIIAFGSQSSDKLCIVSWSSTKIKRVVRSTLAAEACALGAGYDMLIYIRVLLARLLGRKGATWSDQARQVPGHTWIDCKSLDDMLAKTGATATEKRVTLDVDDVRQFLEDESEERHDSDTLSWTPTATMLADPLTKPFAASAWTAMADFLKDGIWKMHAAVAVLYVQCSST